VLVEVAQKPYRDPDRRTGLHAASMRARPVEPALFRNEPSF
jgi:hypothetical protein